MKHNLFAILPGILNVVFIGCISNDSDRCNGDYQWDPASKSCVLSMPDETDTGNPADAGDSPDGGDSIDDSVLSGLGELCTSSEDCAKYEADYCALPPDKDGYCTMSDCTVEPDNCPPDYNCCAFNFDSNAICIPDEEWSAIGDLFCE